MREISVEVQDVEAGCEALYLLHHHQVIGDVIADIRIETQRLTGCWHELGTRSRIAAGKERYLVTLPDKLVRQIGHNAFRAAIQTGWHALDEGRNLRDLHEDTLPTSYSNVTTVKTDVSSDLRSIAATSAADSCD